MSLYFSYGSNMVVTHMAVRCPDARLVGAAKLDDHRFVIASTGYASVVPAKGSAVWGVVWSISQDDERELDIYEAVDEGLYRRAFLDVRMAEGEGATVQALVYVAEQDEAGSADRAYVASVVEAACTHALPREYIDGIREWMPRQP